MAQQKPKWLTYKSDWTYSNQFYPFWHLYKIPWPRPMLLKLHLRKFKTQSMRMTAIQSLRVLWQDAENSSRNFLTKRKTNKFSRRTFLRVIKLYSIACFISTDLLRSLRDYLRDCFLGWSYPLHQVSVPPSTYYQHWLFKQQQQYSTPTLCKLRLSS